MRRARPSGARGRDGVATGPKPRRRTTLRRVVLPMLALTLFTSAAFGDGAGSPGAVLAPPSPLGSALAAKIAECYTAEGGNLTPDDQAVLADLANDLAAEVSIGGTGAGGCGPSCVQSVAGTSCDAIARELDAGAGLDLDAAAFALPSGPPPPWAVQYANALGGVVLGCYTAELDGGAPSDDDTAALLAFQTQLASALGVLTSGDAGACTVNTDIEATCIAAIQAMSCASLAGALDDPAEGVLNALAGPCQGFLDCGLGALGEGGLE